jgi:anti-anti-sigma factor
MPDDSPAVEVEEIQGFPLATILYVSGPIDTQSVESLSQACSAARGRGVRWIVLEVSGVPRVSSTGMSFLTALADELRGVEGAIALVGIQPKVHNAMKTMDLLALFPPFPSIQDAVRHFRKEAGVPEPPPAPPPPRGCLGTWFGRSAR